MSGISDLSDSTLESWRKCFQQQIHSAMSPISPGTLLVWVAEIRRLRAENKELRASYERVDRALRTVSGLHPARDQ